MQIGEFLLGLAAPLAAQLAETAADRQLPFVLVNQLEAEREMCWQRIGAEGVGRDLPATRIEAARLQDEVNERRHQWLVGRLYLLDELGGELGTGTSFERIFCGSVLTSWITFSLSRPGTSHSQRPAGIWLSCASGTVIVTPSARIAGIER